MSTVPDPYRLYVFYTVNFEGNRGKVLSIKLDANREEALSEFKPYTFYFSPPLQTLDTSMPIFDGQAPAPVKQTQMEAYSIYLGDDGWIGLGGWTNWIEGASSFKRR
jgi:hypothetical protein